MGKTTPTTGTTTSTSSTASTGAASGTTGSGSTIPGTGGASAGSGSSSSAGASGGTGSTGASAPSGGSTQPGGTIPAKKSKPAPTGLTSKQSYAVSFAITTPSGGLDTIAPLQRASVLPSDHQALMVELGVLQGGRQVLFALQPGAVVRGPGTCTPGPIDCEILSLRAGQTESLSQASSAGAVPVALFAVTAISAQDHGSAAAAQSARAPGVGERASPAQPLQLERPVPLPVQPEPRRSCRPAHADSGR